MSAGGWKIDSAGERVCLCQSCGKEWPESQLEELRDFFSRVEPGDVVPAGECPDCGAAAMLREVPTEGARPLVVVHVRGGCVQDVEAPEGVSYEVRDYDNCETCGGVECQGGHVQPCPAKAGV